MVFFKKKILVMYKMKQVCVIFDKVLESFEMLPGRTVTCMNLEESGNETASLLETRRCFPLFRKNRVEQTERHPFETRKKKRAGAAFR